MGRLSPLELLFPVVAPASLELGSLAVEFLALETPLQVATAKLMQSASVYSDHGS